MVRRLLIVFFILIYVGFGGRSYAQSQFNPVITKIENSLFGMAYSNQNDDVRLKRIEEMVYGEPSSKPVQQRVSKLSKDLSADLMGQEIKPRVDTFADDEDGYKSGSKADIPKADSSVNYPVVNNLEDRVFNKEFKTLDINKRLSNLEQKTFNRVYNDDLSTRVERLKASVIGADSNMASEDGSDQYSYMSSPTGAGADMESDDGGGLISGGGSPPKAHYYGASPAYNANNSVLDGYKSNKGIGIPLSAIEQSVLSKSFPDDTVSTRLTRLEARVFNSSFAQDDPQTRLERLSSAYQARKTSKKYDSNKMTNRMSTAVQLGAILLLALAFVL